MKRVLFFLVVAIVLAGGGHAGEKTREIKGWGKIADPEGDCEFLDKDGKLIVKVPGTYHDFHPAPPYKNNGPRVYQEVAGDFVVEVKVAATISPEKGKEPKGKNISFRAATLLIWKDGNNFVRLDRAGMWRGGKLYTTTYFHVFKDGKRVFEKSLLVKDEETILRIERKGDTILASTIQGKSVVKLPEQKVQLPNSVQIAVGAINASTQPLEAEFSELKITSAKEK